MTQTTCYVRSDGSDIGRLETFRHLKNDITTASKGLECGMALENFDDLRPEDLIQCYDNIEKPKTLY